LETVSSVCVDLLNYKAHRSTTYVVAAEPTEMQFGLWIRVVLRKYVLYGGAH